MYKSVIHVFYDVNMPMAETIIKKGPCGMCRGQCAISATIENGKITDGAPVRVTTPFGTQIFTAKVTDMAPLSIHIPYGGGSSFMNEAWANANVNELCSLDCCDPISGYPCIKSIPCRLEAE